MSNEIKSSSEEHRLHLHSDFVSAIPYLESFLPPFYKPLKIRALNLAVNRRD